MIRVNITNRLFKTKLAKEISVKEFLYKLVESFYANIFYEF